MSIEDKIQEWARKCGYTGPIPKEMSSFCNESTFHIWTDIIAKVKPRNEVKEIKSKLAIHRLKSGVPLQEAMQKDFCDYNKLTTLAKFKEEMLSHIAEKQLQLQKSQHVLNKNRFEFERIKAVNQEMEMKIFILEGKNESLSMNSSKIQAKVSFMEKSAFTNNELNLNIENIISDELTNYVDKLKFGIGIGIESSEKHKVVDLFHTHRDPLFNAIKVSEDKLYEDLENNLQGCQNIIPTSTNDEYVEQYDDELMELNAVHIKNEIEAKMYDKSIKELQQSLNCVRDSYENKLLAKMQSSTDIDETIKNLQQKAKLIGLKAVSNYMQKNICDLNQHLTLHNKLKHEKLKSNLQEINESIKTSVKSISTNLDQISKNQSVIELKKSLTISEIATLLEINLDYLSITEEKLVSKELDVFHGYPLNYNKLCNMNANEQYFRTNYIFDQPSSNLICKINANPLQTSWDVIIAIYRDLKWLTQLIEASKPSITLIHSDVKIQILTQDLERNSEIVEKLISDLKSAKKGIHLAELQFQKHNFLEMVNIWAEMKFGEFYAQDSFFHNSNFKHYYNDFIQHYNML